jgi:hypothetical protein
MCASRQGTCRALSITLANQFSLQDIQTLTSLVPALDDLTLANVEAQRLASVVAGIKLLATILEGTAVVNFNLVAYCASLVRILFVSHDELISSNSPT